MSRLLVVIAVWVFAVGAGVIVGTAAAGSSRGTVEWCVAALAEDARGQVDDPRDGVARGLVPESGSPPVATWKRLFTRAASARAG
jgi:hypothetical protein